MTAPSGRFVCITEKLKFGNMAAVYIHYDVTPDGTIVRKQLSVPGKYENKEIGELLDAIAERINSDAITAAIREGG
jgi:hypothetical protein